MFRYSPVSIAGLQTKGYPMATLERALILAAEAHTGMTDKGGAPYILHPLDKD